MKAFLFMMACFCALPVAAVAQSRAGARSRPDSAATAAYESDSRGDVPARSRRDADKLIHTLKTAPKGRVRAQAALALRMFPDDPGVIRALINALTDSHLMVRTSAARALSEIVPASEFMRICEIGLSETEPFALNWIRKAAARAAGGASEIQVTADSLGCNDEFSPTEASQHLQSGFLKHLLDAEGYAIGVSMDFTDDGQTAGSASIELTFRGTLRVTGTGSSAAALLEIRAIASNGFVIWQSTIDVDSVGRGPSSHVPGRFDDEFTIRDDGLDARFMAAFEAGRKAAIIFDDDIRGSVASGEESDDESEE